MSIFNKILKEIDRGREGLNHGIPFGLPKTEEIIDGNTKETYTLILSNSGSGKTSLALYAYVYKPLVQSIDTDNFKVLYFSLEMNEVSLYIKLLSIYIFETYAIQLSYKEILSKKKEYILSEEHYELVKQCEPWINKISKNLEIYDKNVTAKSMYHIIKKRLSEMGTFQESETRMTYIPNNPNLIYNVIVDHIGLLSAPAGKLKQEIDLASACLVTLRERCGISPVVIQQANREQGNIERFKQGKSAFTINDAKDSGNTVQDCNVMIALYNPNRDALKNYKHYDIQQLSNSFRSLMILKNRFGDCDVEIGMNFFGGVNIFAELPRPDEIYDYEKYTNPNWIVNKDNNIENKDKSNQKSKFIL